MSTEAKLVRIIPPAPYAAGYQVTIGTKVLMGETEIKGVTKIEIFGDVNDVWRARLSCLIEAPEITVIADVDTRTARSRWQRLMQWFRFGNLGNAAS